MIGEYEGLSLNMNTVRGCLSLEETIDRCQPAGYLGISPSRNDLASMGLCNAVKRLKSSGLTVTGLNPSDLITIGDAKQDRLFVDTLRSALDEAAEISARCLVVVVGGLPENTSDIAGNRNRVTDLLNELVPYSSSCGVPIGLEPLHPVFAADRSIICDLTTASNIAEALGDSLGVVIDTYHIWWDHRAASEIMRLGSKKLLAFHVNDWLKHSTNRLDDRGMIGEGVVDYPTFTNSMTAAGYNGFVEVEIISARLRKEDPDRVLKLARSRMLELLMKN